MQVTSFSSSLDDPRQSDLLEPDALRRRHGRMRSQRGGWDALWQDCYDYALPARRPGQAAGSGSRMNERLFDATAADAAEQLAAALLSQLTPPWSRWFAFQPGRDVPQDQHGAMAAELDKAAELLQAQFDRSNLSVDLRAGAAARDRRDRALPGGLHAAGAAGAG